MHPKLPLSDQLQYCTVRIQCWDNDGNEYTGTGFFFQFASIHEGKHIPVIVTNKHVVEGMVKGAIRLNLADSSGAPLLGHHQTITVETNFEENWIKHPAVDVDLCILPIGPLAEAAKTSGFQYFNCQLDNSHILTLEERDKLMAVEDIIMVGYPNGLWDSKHNLPIIRRGITATNPKVDHNGHREFLIDAACFPGSSGSPVLLFNQGSFSSGDNAIVLGSRIKLLGILYAGPQFTAEGNVEVVEVPTLSTQAITRSNIPMNLGVVIQAERLKEFEELIKAREAKN